MASVNIKPTIGLTGGIASGKSTVAKILQGLGAGVVDADALAREVVAPGTEGLRELVRAFGSGILVADGSLDRKRLGTIVFNDNDARGKLNAITHPRIAALSAERIAAFQASEVPYIVYEAALLVEGGLHRAMNALVVVTSDATKQTARIRTRDGLEAHDAAARIAAQLPTADKVAVADYVIENNGDLTALRERTEQVHREILQHFVQTP